ncbi:hypothetical protein [Pantoea eucrina]|uniref:YCII-related domain-containing protein n=1 Tax=Pantoea eucrina TaxID=472693 RepID=A0ABU5LG78_9GAMM|nr:hypothetical protein [Pantoea eucrina]MDZ7278958.1 hypothetical protein [Pantoea eucrina]
MLHAVTLIYTAQKAAIEPHLDAHKQWLARGFRDGKILFAGPLSDGTGGYILFHEEDVSNVTHFLSEDPFIVHNVAAADVVTLEPALCAQEFPAKWAGKAKPV